MKDYNTPNTGKGPKYYFSYFFMKNGKWGFGGEVIQLSYAIREQDLPEIIEYLKDKNKVDDCVIINWKGLKR